MYQHILLPTDGSELSERAARDGVRLAKSLGARLTALHITPRFYPSELAAYAAPAGAAHEYAARACEHEQLGEASAEQALEPIERMAREAGVAYSAAHSVGDSPWQLIIEAAAERGCDLIFMVSHGRRGVSALLIGSETNTLEQRFSYDPEQNVFFINFERPAVNTIDDIRTVT